MNEFTPISPEEEVVDEHIPTTQVDSNIEKQKKNRMRNATWGASLLTGAGLLFVVVGFLIAEITSWKDYILLGAPAVLFILGLISITLLRRGRVVLGTGLIFVANLIMPLVETSLQTGIGVVVFVYTLISSVLLIWRSLPKSSRRWASVLTGVALLVIVGIELVNSPIRISPADELVTFVYIVTALLALSFIVQAVRQTWGRSMRNKLLVAFIGVTVVATGALGTFMFITTSNNLQENLERELSAQAVDRATRIGNLLNEQINALTTLSLNEGLQQALETKNNSYEGSASDIQATLDARDARWRAADAADNNNDFLVRANLTNAIARELLKYQQTFPDNIEVFMTDVYGGLEGTTNRTSDYYQADEGWWQAAYANGEGAVYISEPEFDESAGAVGVQIALPLRDNATGEITGILRTTYVVSPLTAILSEKIGQTDETDLIIPGEPVSRIDYTGEYEPIEDEEYEALQAVAGQGMVEMEYEDELSVVTQATVQTLEGNPAVDNLGWIVVINQETDEAFAPVNAQVQGLVIVLAIVVALAAAAAYFLSLLLVRPITRLTATAEEVSAGDLDSRAEVTSSDEVGTLATAFNSMTSRLQETLQGLEQRVAERTQNLELAAQVGHSVSQVRALDVMLQDACELIRKEFDLYYTQVYLTNPSQTTLQLQAGTGEVGAQLRARGHSLPFNTGSINGRAAVEKQTVVISDTAESAVFRPNPLLPETRGEMAVPLIVGDKVVGVLDMQSSHPGMLTEEVLPAFEALAGQLAVAIQNATLVAEAQEARAEVEAQARRLVRASWGEHLDAIHKPEKIGFVFNHNEVSSLTEADAAQLSEEGRVVSAPISLTGEMLGSLVVEMDEKYQNEHTSELVNTVARQVAQQLENLRLLESAERFRYEAEQAARRQTREGWQEYTSTRTGDSLGYLYDLNEVRPYSNGQEDASALTLPLKARNEKVGKLSIQGLAADDKESFELATAVAERLGAHIESLRQYGQTQSALAQSEKLFEASRSLTQATDLQELVAATVTTLGISEVNRALLTTFDYDSAGDLEQLTIIANWWNETGHEVTPIGTRYPLEVIRVMPMFVSPTPVFFDDTFIDERVDATTMELVKKLNLRAVAALPLHLGSQQIGSLILEAEDPHNFTPDETRLFESLAPQIATVLENRQQYERAQKQAEREGMLNTINQKIQSATSVEAVLQIAARELGHALGAPMTIAQLSMKDKN